MTETAPDTAANSPNPSAGLDAVDILVGVPSFNNAKTIGHVVRAVEAGLTKYFPDCRSVLVNSDGGSTDGTTDVVR
ncbi:MAG: glycosyltransferase, partial [Candidatus Aminicenantales bacterium]